MTRNWTKAVYLWFKQKIMEGIPISGPMLCERAVELCEKLHGETEFTASSGWKWIFCRRHEIRQLSLQGEKLSADMFVSSFKKLIEKNLSLNQVFNADESGLYFRLLLTSSWLEALRRVLMEEKWQRSVWMALNFTVIKLM